MKTLCWMTLVVNRPIFSITTGPIWALFCLIVLNGCDQSSAPVHLNGPTMGTFFNVTLVEVPSDSKPKDLQQGVEQILADINQAASTYIEDSELMKFNAVPAGTVFELSPTLSHLLSVSGEIYRVTEGAYDVTVGPVVNLWGFGPRGSRTVPDSETLESTLKLVGFENISLDQATAKKLLEVQVDLSSVAKGYAVDRIASYLNAAGVEHYLVEVGGEIRVRGNNPKGDLWRIGIESPSVSPSEPAKAVTVTNMGMATSGDYRNFFEENGLRYSHTIDPRTGRPITHNLASVTVLDESSARADALATGLNVMGEPAARDVCEQQNLACFFITYDNNAFKESYSTAFEQFID